MTLTMRSVVVAAPAFFSGLCFALQDTGGYFWAFMNLFTVFALLIESAYEDGKKKGADQ